MLAIGYTSKGERLEFNCIDGELSCHDSDLVTLDVPVGVKKIWCWDNLLTELKLPESVKYVSCSDNKLMELTIPESVVWISCDKEIKGLEELIGKVKINLW